MAGQPPDDPDETDELTPAERRVVALVGPLRQEEVYAPALRPEVIRRARWQRGVRSALRTVGTLLGSVSDVFSGFVGSRRRT